MRVLLFIAIALTGAAPAVAQKIDLTPGKYEVVANAEASDAKMPPRKRTQCITAEQVKDASKTFLDPKLTKECKVSDVKVTGNKMTFRTVCGQGSVQTAGTAEVTFATESYTVVMSAKTGDGHTMTIKQSAKRIGACTT
jgi:hypothetical protein